MEMTPEPAISAAEMAKLLRDGELEAFTKRQFDEPYLREVADVARAAGQLDVIAAELISRLIIRPSRAFDWNAGSLLQHAEPEEVFQNLPSAPSQREPLYESIGLTWCLGEFSRRDPRAVAFLEDAVARARSSASWFRAAQSLEKLGLVDAISYLKASLRSQGVRDLVHCLSDMSDYRNRIGILLHATVDNLQKQILPAVKFALCDPHSDGFQKLGAAWVAGRFRYIDPEIQIALVALLESERYEVCFYALQAIRDIRSQRFVPILQKYLKHDDPLLRKMAAEGLGAFYSPQVVLALEEQLFNNLNDSHPDVLGAITHSLYDITHHAHRREREISQRIGANENGMIVDEGDKWYVNPDIYHVFSESQDPQDLCFRVALQALSEGPFQNPIDVGSGTGRFASFLLEALPFESKLMCIDASEEMTHFLEARLRREGVPESRFVVKHGKIENLVSLVGEEVSDLVVANFAFPSRITNRELALTELQAVSKALRPNGFFLTIGWDETFNDQLSEMWYKFVPDGIVARNFEEWRQARCRLITSARNCGLTWLKRGLRVPVEFNSPELAARVMGYLFGRSAAEEIMRSRQDRWTMAVGITLDSKERLTKLLPGDRRSN
jgi:ubiquinone/menaquinone biosynthesis C-methylase UbiE